MTGTLLDLKSALEGRYALGPEIGRGGMAAVYRARDLRHDRLVAVKVLNPELTVALGAERFLREIRFVAGLNHPHILPLHDSGEADGLIYFVMPYVEGETLRDRLDREKQVSIEETLKLAESVASALDHAHRRGVIHRDIKPGNILLQDGQAVVCDFGVALSLTRTTVEARLDAGSASGTLAYMSPEALIGDVELDGRADEYSLACVLYEMLAGRPAFMADTPIAITAAKLSGAVAPLAERRPDVPPAVAAAIMTALAKEPGDRFATLRAFAEALRASAADLEPSAARSVAVLPFSNLGGTADEEFLSGGITDEIITALTRIDGLHVASRTSAFAIARGGGDARAIGRQLHVRSVLEGGVQRSDDRLRVSVRLVNVVDGYLLWSDRYDRDMRDVYAIQDEISQNVARALQVILSDDERSALARVPTRDVGAYEAYTRGRAFFRQTRRKSLQYAREMFERAIVLDPGFALAWAGVADSCSLLDMYFPGSSHADLGRADETSARALAIDPGLADAHASRGFALWRLKRTDAAVAEFQTAMRLDRKQFEARYFYARLSYQRGDMEAAADLFEDAARAREDYQARFFAAQSCEGLGRKAQAANAYRRALQVVRQHLSLNPDDPRAATMCAVSLCRLGDQEEGLRWAERARAIDPDDPGVLYNVACLYALEKRSDDAIDCLRQAFEAGFGGREWIMQDPDLDSLHEDPRFMALVWPAG